MNSFDWVSFGARLRFLRLQKKMSLTAVSNNLGITKSTLGSLEHGRRGASIEVIIALATFFNVSTDYLLGLSDDPTPSQHRGGVSEISKEE